MKGTCLWCWEELRKEQRGDGFCSEACFHKRLERGLEGFVERREGPGGFLPLMERVREETIARRRAWQKENPKRRFRYEF